MAFLIFSFWWDTLLCLVALLTLFIWRMRRNFSYWNKKSVFNPKANPLFGNMGSMLTGKKNLGEVFGDLYDEHKHLPFIGMFMVWRPTLVVNDPELTKRLLVKDFAHFHDHIFDANFEHEPLAGHLFNLKGETWKNLRAKLTPTFTTSRMKEMFGSLEPCIRDMMEHLESEKANTTDVKELLGKFTTDVIGRCAFGLECNSFNDPDAEFRSMGRKIFNLSPLRVVLQFFFFFFPSLMKHARFSTIGDEINSFFMNTVKNTVEYREKNNVVRNDFMQLLINLKNDNSVGDDDTDTKELVDDGTTLSIPQLAAQVFVFFIAGFETSSTTGSFALYELALNPDVQTTLVEEIDRTMEKCDGKLTYDSLGGMTYLTKVIEETLRKYPPVPVLFRECTKDYIIPDTNVLIEKNTPVMIPIYGIQRDPQYFPNPEKFDPERFSPENKQSRHHFAYLPFGEGPRICIGSRFGMMQTRLGLAMLLHKYEVSVCEKTKIPTVYDKKSFILTCEGGMWLRLTKRGKK